MARPLLPRGHLGDWYPTYQKPDRAQHRVNTDTARNRNPGISTQLYINYGDTPPASHLLAVYVHYNKV